MSDVAFIALGSNLGDRQRLINSAIEQLDQSPGVTVESVSNVIETEPVGPAGQGAYFNAAARLHTSLEPHQLLQACLTIETAHGRDRRTTPRWGPRTLDIDVLLFGDRIIAEPGLVIPHPHLHEREFVLRPLCEIAPQIVHPVLGMTIECLLSRLPMRSRAE